MAIVLRIVEFSESSYVVTLFTEDFGKITALAKGAKRPKGPFESALDLLAVCRIVFLHKSSDALDLLTEAKLERRFRAATRSLARLYAGYYVAELLTELTDEGDPHPDLFRAARDSLAALEGEEQLDMVVVRYELTALRLLGHLPRFGECVRCSEAVGTEGRIAFGQLAGGVLCQRCRIGHRQVVSVTADTIKILQQISDPQLSKPHKIEVKRTLRGELRGLLNQYVSNLLGHRPKMHKYLELLAE